VQPLANIYYTKLGSICRSSRSNPIKSVSRSTPRTVVELAYLLLGLFNKARTSNIPASSAPLLVVEVMKVLALIDFGYNIVLSHEVDNIYQETAPYDP
jgi:hypothetical protein